MSVILSDYKEVIEFAEGVEDNTGIKITNGICLLCSPQTFIDRNGIWYHVEDKTPAGRRCGSSNQQNFELEVVDDDYDFMEELEGL